MTNEDRHHPSGPLVVAVVLALVAGFVDGYVFLGIAAVFVANMSGNLIRLGLALGDGDGHALWLALVALAGFLVATMIGSTLSDRRLRRAGGPSAAPLIAIETAILTVLWITVSATEPVRGTSGVGVVGSVAAGSLAMGLQAVSLRRVGTIAVSTTYGTGALVRIGEKLALGMRRADRASDVRRRTTIFIIATILVGYVTGAVVASLVDSTDPRWLAAPVVASATAAVLAWAELRR